MIKINITKAKQVSGDNSLFISFPFDGHLLEIVRSFPIKYWHAQDKVWELPFNKLGEFVNKVPEQEIEINMDSYISLAQKTAVIPKGFEFKTKPFEHQIDGFNYGLNHDRWLLADEQGLGKTKQVIDIAVAKKLQYGNKHCLIICGVNGLKYNWQNEIATHSNETGYILGTRGNKIGSSADKLEDLNNLDNIDSYFLITNVETLRYKEWTGKMIKARNGKETKEYVYPITDRLENLCKSGEINMVAFDEFHKVKNSESDQGAQILRLQPKCRIAMTGTPVMNQPLDLYEVLRWLGYETHTFYSFRKHYCEMGGFGGYQIVGYKHLDELTARLDEIMLRRLKKEVLDLPDKLYIDEFVDLTPKQAQIYNEVKNNIRANIDQIKKATNPLAELIRMRQATGYTGILSTKIKESAKLDRMEELVEDAVQNGKKVVIFSNWSQITDEVLDRLADYNPLIITGDTKDSQRQLYVDKFQNDDKYKVMIGTIGAMGTGLTLTAGTIEIFLDEPWNRANKEQAEDRCHRVGTKENVTIYTIMAKNTIDERIHDLVYKKGKIADMLVDGELVANKEEILDFLLS